MTVAPELPPAPAVRRGKVDLAIVPPPRAGRPGAVRRRGWAVASPSAAAGPAQVRPGLRRVGRPPAEPVGPSAGGGRPGPLPPTRHTHPVEARCRADRVPEVGPGEASVAATGRGHHAAGAVRPWPAGSPAARGGGRVVKLSRRGRRLVGMLAVLAGALAVIAAAGRVQAMADRTPVPASAPAEVVVAPGETLWSIAARVAPDRDPRGVVHQIRELNGLASGDLQAGQRLRLRVG